MFLANKILLFAFTAAILKEQRKYDKGQIFIKIMAGFLALLMVVATGGTLIYALIG